MKILGIETSCDETAVAVLEVKNNKIRVLANTISSQVKLHAKYGGVVPNLAAREHVKNIGHVFKLALKEASYFAKAMKNKKIKIEDIDLVAVTHGPGLGPALLVGITFAKTLAWKYDKPIIGINHLEGHIYSNFLKKVGGNLKLEMRNEKLFPILNLIVSGGHTELVLMTDHGKYKIIGETLDDAIGEAFDKVARLLGLSYPGGPAIAKRVTELKVKNLKSKIEFPRPMNKSKDYNFSYSGLKTSVLYKIRDLKNTGVKITEDIINEICHEFQNAAIEILIKKTIRAAKEYEARSIFLSGGVSANNLLRSDLARAAANLEVNYSQPELEYTGDNAAMIALAGYFSAKNKKTQDLTWNSVEMDANLGF